MRTAPPITAAVLALTLAGCGSASGEDAAPSATTPEQVEPTTAAPTFAHANETDETQAEAVPADLLSVSLTPSGDALQVTWELMSAPYGQTGYYLTVASQDGQATGQLGVKANRQTVTEHFAFLDGQNTNLNGGATVRGNEVRATFPLDDVQEAVGDEFMWYATTTANGEDVDAAPRYTDPINREYLIFEGP